MDSIQYYNVPKHVKNYYNHTTRRKHTLFTEIHTTLNTRNGFFFFIDSATEKKRIF